MAITSKSLKKAALVFSAFIIGVGLLGTLVFIFYSAKKSQKSFGNLSVPTAITDSPKVFAQGNSSSSASSSSIPIPSFDTPDFLKAPKTSVKNRNIQLKQNPSQGDVDAYIAEVKRVAVSVLSVTIDGCEPDPVVVRATPLSDISFVNNDAVIRLITIEDKRFAIEAHGSHKIPMSFASGTGIYNYDCDSNFSVGTLWIE